MEDKASKKERSDTLVPVRMVAQYAYCPRLAFLEWVQKEWADNYFTKHGRYHHRRVDQESGDPDAPEVRAVTLTAPRAGLITKLDLLEQDSGEVVPVEYKRGKPTSDGPTRSERVQLAAQGLVLRENGFRCKRGILYYATSKQRVELEFEEAILLEAQNLKDEMVTEFRERGVIPQPLVNDSRCGHCSLNGICLPEEVNFLRRASEKVRPLWALHEESHPLYVTEHGSKVGLKGERLFVRYRGEEVGTTRLSETSQVNLIGNVQITTQALRVCARRGSPVLFFGYGNWFLSGLNGLPHKNVELRQTQFRVALDSQRSLDISKCFVTSKIANQRVMLRRNSKCVSEQILKELKRLRVRAARCESMESLLGLEGLAAKLYFQEFPRLLKTHDFHFQGRNRRPPTAPVNAVLSFLYAVLAKEATVALHTVGFDPYQGFFHQGRYGRPSLALDLMEEFRPLVADSATIRLFNSGRLKASDFIRMGDGCSMKPKAKKTVLEGFERRMSSELTHPIFGYKASYRRTLTLQARLLARHLMGEIGAYPGLETR